MRKILLTNGGYTKVDDDDYDWLNQWNWQQCRDGYAIRSSYARNGKTGYIFLHRELLKPQSGLFTDHINGNRLDNRRSNLRKCTMQQNGINRKMMITNTSGYVGVTKDGNTNWWKAYTYFGNKRLHLVSTLDKVEAAYIRDQFVMQLFGEFARTNFKY